MTAVLPAGDDPGVAYVNRAVNQWLAARVVAAELDIEAHPPITDRYGRVWTWKSEISGQFVARGFYVHCGSAYPDPAWIERSRLAPVGLATNPNYDLCEICRSEWPEGVIYPPRLCRSCWRVNTPCTCWGAE